MATITLRSVKGSPLTNAEVDANFSNINDELATKLSGTGGITVPSVTLSGSGGEPGVATLTWNDTAGTLDLGLKGGNVTMQLGEELFLRVTNATGSAIPKGSVVYITSSTGSHVNVVLSQANSEGTSSKTLGITAEAIANAQTGFVATNGIVSGLDTSALTEGGAVWLSATVAGGLTSTRPSPPNHAVLIGWCVKSHASVGALYIHIANGYEVAELHDVLLTSITNNQVLSYESASGLWKNRSLATVANTGAFSDILSKPTTLSGYGITDAPTVTGTGASGTWGISITGNAATATRLINLRTINGVGFDGTADITIADGTKLPLAGGTLTGELYVPNLTVGGQGRSALNAIGGNIGATAGSWNNAQLELKSTDAGTVALAFHRAGYTSNTIEARDGNGLRIDGSFILHAGNYNSYALPLTGGTLTGPLTAPNFRDAAGAFNVNLGSGGTEGRGVAAGYSGGAYGGVGFNVRHTATSEQYIAPTGDTVSYLRFDGGGFRFFGSAAGAAGRTVTFSAPGNAYLDLSGNWYTAGQMYATGSQHLVLNTGNYSSYSAFSGLVTSSGNNGFANATWFANVRNPIWSFANSSSYGISYFQGSAGRDGTDTITLHPNGSTTATGAAFAVNGNNAFVQNNVVLHAGNYNSYALPLTGGTLSGALRINTSGTGSASSHVRITRSGAAEPGSFGSYSGAWRPSIEVWNIDSTRMLFLNPPESDSAYANIKSVGGGFFIDVGASGATRAIQIESSGAANFPQGVSSAGAAVLTTGNYNSYALPLSGGTMTGNLQLGSQTNRFLSWYTNTNWFYYLAGEGNNLRLYDSDGTSFLQTSYGSGGATKWVELLGSALRVNNNGTVTSGGKFLADAWLQSDRDFPNGTLITTDIPYNVTNGDPFILEIRGNTYGNIVPLDIQYQGYIYSDTIINHGGISNGLNIGGLVAINNGGNLCFWFPSQGYWNGYYVRVYVPYATYPRNRVTSITGVAKPTTAKEVGLSANIRQSLHSGNYNSYSPTLTGGGASGTWGINITGSAATLQGYQWNSAGKDIRGSDIYADSWLRNYNSGTGLYNQATSNHWYSDGAYWNVGYAGANGIRLRNGHAGTVLGHLYADTSANFGLLDQNGNWAVRVKPGSNSGGQLYNTWDVSGALNMTSRNNGLLVSAANTSSSGGAIAIQQVTGEGWTGIFCDFEPFTGWGLWHDNPNNYFSFTSENSTGSLRSFTVPSRYSGDRTAYEKFRIEQGTGNAYTGATHYAYSYRGHANVGGTGEASHHPAGIYSQGTNWLYGTIYLNSNTIQDCGRMNGPWTSAARCYSSEWIEFPNYSGLYSQLNSAHFYPNNVTHGSWRIAGSRNGWHGIHFDSGSTLMMNSETVGFHREGYGWQMRWASGTGYISKSSPGGGTDAVILDSSNYNSYSPTLTGGNASGSWNITAARATRANGNFYIDDNYGNGIVGVYASTRYQGVFAMGDSYKLPADGTSAGNLYGLAWSYPSAGGVAGNLDSHGLLVLINGGLGSAISYSIVAAGNVTAYSDERLKTNWRSMPENFVERLAQVKSGIYDRIDGEQITQVGIGAQSFQRLLPEAITQAKDEMGTLSVSYGNAAMASAVELAKEIVAIKRELEALKARLH